MYSVITLTNPHSKPLKIVSTWTDMPGAKVARLTTFDPESARISGWNGQVLYVFDRSHAIEYYKEGEDSTPRCIEWPPEQETILGHAGRMPPGLREQDTGRC